MRTLFFKFFLIFLILTFANAEDNRGLKLIVDKLGENNYVGKQYLFIIAIDQYKNWFPLKNPVKDAKEIKNILTSRYFIDDVTELYNKKATKANIIKTFKKLQKKLEAHDSLLIFYAGHGHLDDTTNSGFWIPVNAGTDIYEQQNWLPNNQIRGMISKIKASHIFLISDSCFSGDILNTSRAFAPTIDNSYFQKAYSRISRQVLTSGASESVPDVSEFARQLKLALQRNMNTYLDPLMLFNQIRLGISDTSPLLGSLKETGHQNGASFLLFLKAEGTTVTEDTTTKEDTKEEKTKKDTGSISVKVITGGKLYINENYKNDISDSGKLLIVDIEAGNYVLEMHYKDSKEKKNVTVKKNATTNVEFTYREKKNDNAIYGTIETADGSLFDSSSEDIKVIVEDNRYFVEGKVKSTHSTGGWAGFTIKLPDDVKNNLKADRGLHRVKGIRFIAGSNVREYYCQFRTTDVKDSGYHQVLFYTDHEPREIVIMIDSLYQPYWAEEVPFRIDNLDAVSFLINSKPGQEYNFTLEIFDLEAIIE